MPTKVELGEMERPNTQESLRRVFLMLKDMGGRTRLRGLRLLLLWHQKRRDSQLLYRDRLWMRSQNLLKRGRRQKLRCLKGMP